MTTGLHTRRQDFVPFEDDAQLEFLVWGNQAYKPIAVLADFNAEELGIELLAFLKVLGAELDPEAIQGMHGGFYAKHQE